MLGHGQDGHGTVWVVALPRSAAEPQGDSLERIAQMNRRKFLQNAGFTGASLLASGNLFSAGAGEVSFPQLETITVGGREIHPGAPPRGLRNFPDLGILVNRGMSAQRIYAHAAPDDWCGESRGIKTPGGDYLVMFTAGQHHYGGQLTKTNDMVAFRSSDQGKTWSGPKIAWNIPYNQHGFVPLIPRGSKRMYAFGTEPLFKLLDMPEDAPIGYRYSDDDGHTWSQVTLIHPANDPDFRGFFVMRMCETGHGTWLLAPSVSHYNMNCGNGKRWCPPVLSCSYIMRSTDQGRSWNLLPGPRPRGWAEPSFHRMDEARPISLEVQKFCCWVEPTKAIYGNCAVKTTGKRGRNRGQRRSCIPPRLPWCST